MKRTVETTITVRAAAGRVRDVLVDDPGVAFAESRSADDRRSHRFHAVLSVDNAAGTGLQQEVIVETRAPSFDGETFVLPLEWRPIGHARLVPSFAGELRAAPDRSGTRLELRGTYEVPLGLLGRVGDDVAGHRLASRSLATLLERVAHRLDTEVDRRLGSHSPRRS